MSELPATSEKLSQKIHIIKTQDGRIHMEPPEADQPYTRFEFISNDDLELLQKIVTTVVVSYNEVNRAKNTVSRLLQKTGLDFKSIMRMERLPKEQCKFIYIWLAFPNNLPSKASKASEASKVSMTNKASKAETKLCRGIQETIHFHDVGVLAQHDQSICETIAKQLRGVNIRVSFRRWNEYPVFPVPNVKSTYFDAQN